MSWQHHARLYHLQYGGKIKPHNERNRGKHERCQVFIPQALYRLSEARASTSKAWNQCIGVELISGEAAAIRDYLLRYNWPEVEGRPSTNGLTHITREVVGDVIEAGGF